MLTRHVTRPTLGPTKIAIQCIQDQSSRHYRALLRLRRRGDIPQLSGKPSVRFAELNTQTSLLLSFIRLNIAPFPEVHYPNDETFIHPAVLLNLNCVYNNDKFI
jgi:hypothetical protein